MTTPIPQEFVGRRALATGGPSGIAAAIAQRLLDGGAAVVVKARSSTNYMPSGDLRKG